jgi:hypothetical protein
LRLLEREAEPGPAGQRPSYFRRLMPDDERDGYRLYRGRGPQDVLDEGQPAGAVKDLRGRRLHARPLAGGKNDDVGGRHGGPLV